MGVYIGEPYMEVEYIQSSGTQCINTGFNVTKNSKIFVDIQFTSTTVQQRVFGVDNGLNGVSMGSYINGSGKYSRFIGNGGSSFTFQATTITADTSRHTFTLDNSRYIITTSGSEVSNTTNSQKITNNPTNNQLAILAQYGPNEDTYYNYASAKLYACKIWDNDVLVRDFVPCYKTSNNEIGLFDKVENKFYANSGTGTFTKGNDVKLFQPELKNAYIGEVYEYSYDFRGKTIAQVNSDLGTTFTSAYSIDANGLKATSWDAVYFQLPGSDYSTANKITMTIDGYIGSSGINDVSLRACLYQNGSASNHTGNYITPGSGNGLFVGGTKQAYTNTISNYDFSLTSVFNLQTKVASIEYTQGSSFSNTYTITDAQVTNIRGLNYYWIALNGAGHIKQFSLTIE